MAHDMLPEASPQTDQEILREKWITELRRQGHRQCRGLYFSGHRACALGLLVEITGLKEKPHDDLDLLGDMVDLSREQVREVVDRNDGIHGYADGKLVKHDKHTFAEIADVVESWFR